MARRIVFVERNDWIDPLVERYSEGSVFASIDEFIIESLREKGAEVLWLPELLTDEDRHAIDREAWKSTIDFAEHPKLRELFSYRGIPVGSCGVLQMCNCFVWALKIQTAIRRLFESRDFDEIVCGHEQDPEAFTTLEPSRQHLLCARVVELLGKQATSVGFDTRRPSSGVDGLKNELRNLAYLGERIRHVLSRWSGRNKPCTAVSGALKQLSGIIEPLLANGHRLVHVDIEYRLAKLPFLRKHGIPYHAYAPSRTLYRWFPNAESRRYRRNWPESRREAVSILKSEAILSFRGDNFYPLLESRFDFFLDDFLHERRLNVDFFLGLLQNENVRAVVSDEDTLSFRKTLALCAKQTGAATSVICHNSTPTFLGHELMPLTSDRMSVGGPFILENFSTAGIPKQRLRACGLPRYDRLHTGETSLAPEKVRRLLGIPEEKRVIVFASTLYLSHRNNQRTWWEIQRALEDAAHCLKSYPDDALIVKFHPITEEEAMRRTRRLVDAIRPGNNHYIRDIDTPSVFKASSLVFTFFSSVVTESMLLNKPTVILDYFRNERVGPFFPEIRQNGLSFIVSKREEMRRAVDGVLAGDRHAIELFGRFRNGIVEGWAGSQDGRSAGRIVEMIEELSCN